MIGGFIREQRMKRGITQAEVALKLGISRPTYIQIERGEHDLTVNQAKSLAGLFDMLLDDFLNERETERKVVLEKPLAKYEPEPAVEIRVQTKDLQKFKQVFLYVLEKIGGKPNVGETVLHKLLYFIDFDYYEIYEENLMGLTYIKNIHGPTSVEFGAIVKEMVEKGEVHAVKSEYFEYTQKKYLAVNNADLSILSAQELLHIDRVLARLSDKNAKEIEEYSHGDLPWKITEDGKKIPYEAVFYRGDPYSVGTYDEL